MIIDIVALMSAMFFTVVYLLRLFFGTSFDSYKNPMREVACINPHLETKKTNTTEIK